MNIIKDKSTSTNDGKMSKDKIKELFLKLNINNEDQCKEIYETLNLEHGLKVKEYGNNPSFYITDNFDINLYQIDFFVRLLSRKKELPYNISKSRDGKTDIKEQESAVFCRYIRYWCLHFKANLVYGPYIDLFFKAIEDTDYPCEQLPFDPAYTFVNSKTLAEYCNDLAAVIIDQSQSKEFKKRLHNQNLNGYRSFSSLIKYIDRLFEKHSRLLFIRIDLSLQHIEIPEDESALHQLLQYFEQFRKIMSRKAGVFEGLDGYVAHVEYGLEKGHHIHLALFYYEQVRRADYFISHQIGQTWEEITKGAGLWYSTNRNKRRPDCNALGKIHRDDLEKRYCMYYTLWYVVKADQYLHYKYSNKQRLFFRGILSK